ncbi:hypothetical protein [Pseudosulfitobacter sp. SM2401]|uniref:hypothetical protein n=1 Tax=Pseudosulfitobacter sp. SM2401 TaxID=3350098 RepID=UPI0036F36514
MPDQTPPIPAGWVGGFEQSNPDFAYPDPNLTSLDMLGNLDNIDKLQRQQAVLWPEFSWETEPGAADPKRAYQMFAPDISRLGYTDEGRVYSIICPQQGVCSPAIGCLNVEVTVTGQRGWANETDRTLAADMEVTGKIWFSPSAKQKTLYKVFWEIFKHSSHPFPSSKEHAIEVTTFRPGQPDQPIFPLLKGQSKTFPIPDFAKHEDDGAWSVGNLAVEIGPIKPTGDSTVDKFNELVLEVFNLGAGNMLKQGNTLTWNVWFNQPGLVDQEEWAAHAEKWRQSIDADHGSPDGEGTEARYFDGSPFSVVQSLEDQEIKKITSFIKSHL